MHSKEFNNFLLAMHLLFLVVFLFFKWTSHNPMEFLKEIKLYPISQTFSSSRQMCQYKKLLIIFTSNLKRQRIFKALETALEVYNNRSRKISTSELNDFLLPIVEYNPPPTYKGKYVRIKYVTQLPSQTPTFAFYCNLPQYIKDPYKRFLENKIREEYDLAGVTVRLFFRKK